MGQNRRKVNFPVKTKNMAKPENHEVDLACLRPAKAACFRAQWDKYDDRSGRLGLRRLTDVTLSAMGQRPGITPAHGRFIDDCDFYAELVASGPGATHIEGSVLYAGYMRKSWGHFLMNSTARLWPLFVVPEKFDKIVFFAEGHEACGLHANFKEFLSLLGVLDKCVVLPPSAYSFDALTIGDPSLENGCYYSREFAMPFDAVRAAALSGAGDAAPAGISKGILLSRSKWGDNKKLQINIERLEALFTSAGYTAVSPENTPLTSLIRLMDRAGEVVSFSGSTAHNMMFCADKPFVMLERCAANNTYQIGLMKLKGNTNALVDCFFQPLLTSSTDNLTIYGATDELKRFASCRAMPLPAFSLSPGKEFGRYLKIYRRHYGYGPGINSWEESQAPAVFEAYFASRPRYAACIDRHRPVAPADFLSPRVLYRWIKNLLLNKP